MHTAGISIGNDPNKIRPNLGNSSDAPRPSWGPTPQGAFTLADFTSDMAGHYLLSQKTSTFLG